MDNTHRKDYIHFSKILLIISNKVGYLDLSLFDINKDTDIRFMFYKCNKLKLINGINLKDKNNKMFCLFLGCNDTDIKKINGYVSKCNMLYIKRNENIDKMYSSSVWKYIE